MTSSANSPTISEKAFTGLGSLIRLLPTGTIFLFQFASPLLTNSGAATCGATYKALDAALIALCGASCCFACFTDSYVSAGKRRYGIITRTGLWTSGGTDLSAEPDLSRYRLRFGDFVHAFFSLVVFAALALLDSNTVRCFYPEFVSEQKLLLQVLPPVIGALSGVIFMLFPNERHGIGYPESSDYMSNTNTNTNTNTNINTAITSTPQNPNSVEHA